MISFRRNFFFITVWLVASCQHTDANHNDRGTGGSETYKIGLHPESGSKYQYEIENETSFVAEVEGKEADNVTKTNALIRYTVSKDSIGNFLFAMNYDKISLYTKKGDIENDLNGDKGTAAIDPVEKMLALLKTATITTRVTPSGKVIAVDGYKELGTKMFEGVHNGDPEMKNALQQQWEKLAGESIIQKNLDQFFSIFPDSAVHIGNTWEQSSIQAGELPMTIHTTYKLKSVNNDVAVIVADGRVVNKGNASGMMGYSNVEVKLEGTQAGFFEIHPATGMLLEAEIKSKVKGELNMMGREVPVSIKNSISINRRKI